MLRQTTVEVKNMLAIPRGKAKKVVRDRQAWRALIYCLMGAPCASRACEGCTNINFELCHSADQSKYSRKIK